MAVLPTGGSNGRSFRRGKRGWAVLAPAWIVAAIIGGRCGGHYHAPHEALAGIGSGGWEWDTGGSGPQGDSMGVDLGTTLVAIKYKDGVAVGADSRTSLNHYVSHRFATKVSRVAPHIVVARSGSAADTQHLADRVRLDLVRRSFRYGISADSFPTSTVAHFLKNIVYGSGNEMSASLIVAGYNVATNEPKIYTVAPSGALLEEARYAMAGSGSTFITGFLDQELSPAVRGGGTGSSPVELEEDGAVELCRRAIELAVQRDGSSGGVARIYVCDATGVKDVTERTTPGRTTSTNNPTDLVGFARPPAKESAS